MKSYNHLYEICISETNRRESLKLAKHSPRLRDIFKNRHMGDDAIVEKSFNWIVNYKNAEHEPVYIYDGTVIMPSWNVEPILPSFITFSTYPAFSSASVQYCFSDAWTVEAGRVVNTVASTNDRRKT